MSQSTRITRDEKTRRSMARIAKAQRQRERARMSDFSNDDAYWAAQQGDAIAGSRDLARANPTDAHRDLCGCPACVVLTAKQRLARKAFER